MAAIAGGSRAGVRCYTATAGPGTLRGLEGIVLGQAIGCLSLPCSHVGW